jgi:hypothetical protein
LAIDSLSDLPDSTSDLTLARIPPKCGFSAWLDSRSERWKTRMSPSHKPAEKVGGR